MASLEHDDEVQEQLLTVTPQSNAMIMQVKNQETEEKRTDESNLSMQAEPCIATAELQTAEQMREEENRNGSAVETAAKEVLMKQTENEMKTSGSNNDVQRECNIEQSESETKIAVQLYFHKTDERSVDLSNRNNLNNKSEQDRKLEKQSGKTISDEQNCEEISGERYGKEVYNSGNASSNVKRKSFELKLLKLNQRYGYRTFSTFKLPEQELLRREALYIYNGATFRCFDEFEKYFEAYKIVGNNPYRVASSEVLRDGEGKVIERFKYKYIVFHCAHYGNPRKRGGGKRPNQSYLPLGCKARFRLNADITNGCLRISSFHKEHVNHENSEQNYSRVVNKKRRNITDGPGSKIMKLGTMDETEKAISRYDNIKETMPDVNKNVNASEIAKNNPVSVISSSKNSTFTNSSKENSIPTKISFSRSSTISSQENSPFVPITLSQSTEMNMPSINSHLQQTLTVQLFNRLKRIEYLIMNAYIIKCGRYLPEKIYFSFIHGVYGADYHLSEWSDVQLKDVMRLFLQPPEILLQDELPTDISIDEVKQVRVPRIQRAITAIKEEKLKRCDRIIARHIKHIFNAMSTPDFLMAVREFQKFVNDVKNMNTNDIK